ncbi:MAG: hypothetical protein AAB569_05865, partial [Patescibacteria group bacterium]
RFDQWREMYVQVFIKKTPVPQKLRRSENRRSEAEADLSSVAPKRRRKRSPSRSRLSRAGARGDSNLTCGS